MDDQKLNPRSYLLVVRKPILILTAQGWKLWLDLRRARRKARVDEPDRLEFVRTFPNAS